MSTLELNVRYFQDSTPADVPCREEHFRRRHVRMSLPVVETALVLVDLWNIHFCDSWLERAKRVTVEAVLPVMDAARRAGLTIVHAPSPPVAVQYPQLRRHTPPPQLPAPTWPPAEFVRREGRYHAFRGPRDQPPGIGYWWNPLAGQLSLSPVVGVLDDEFVIATGQQLHDLCEERRILHLIFAGFATNWCIVGRDYGMRAM